MDPALYIHPPFFSFCSPCCSFSSFLMSFIPLVVSVPPHLYGSFNFGDNVEDEWFVVYLLCQLTKTFSGLLVRSLHSIIPTPPRSSLHTTLSSGLPLSHLCQRTPTNLHTAKFTSRQFSRLQDRVSHKSDSPLITPVAANSCQLPPAVPRNVALTTTSITYDPTTGAGPLIRSIITQRGLSLRSIIPTPPRSSLHTTLSSGLPPSHLCQRTPICIRPSSPLANSRGYKIAFSISPTHRNGGVSSFGPITALYARHKRTLLCQELRTLEKSAAVFYGEYSEFPKMILGWILVLMKLMI
ncbi:unnamed protein product [Acanthosepion pharaonis]|uniref:Uncharacterized protein n=1 Tax=Acanthosepion pharaonis TaxID=158019 RepID=A0A812DE60_ACAPH|nr:unnamed protein product [Sepia pharaonis]